MDQMSSTINEVAKPEGRKDVPTSEYSPAQSTLQGIEQLAIHGLLRDITFRLSSVEDVLKQKHDQNAQLGRGVLDFAKTVLGSWAAFGFLFLLLFYFPLRDVLLSLPAKIQSADEIGVGSVTLKSTIQRVAVSQGVAGLGESIPALSNQAIQLLLRAPRDGEGVMSFSSPSGDQSLFSAFSMPSDSMANALSELQQRGFIHLEGRLDGMMKTLQGPELIDLIRDIKRTYPGHVEPTEREGRIYWTLTRPIARDAPHPDIMWRLSDAGIAAVRVMLTAVSSEIARSRKKGSPD